ncbi:hypothetical protein COCVIDRAFT_102216 [Bipolaris victoriae FI3]|uniref:Uncharacterized protein n=2 Tax=Bipolaris TaxID=33194 RepID=W6Z6T6_COCC2|nr:uncharacterized protein COCCADRAFT_80666 [Bipolaris zeicola 26-R-13]XP_014555530.1 hypothetical protein COCVIDRAFT_102216 [Bipolaris victoriae FI3]EUC39396.1 hypothetical protein COCCADRAFT_80666 [Bipolaris zeicola 26-R-13]
MRKAWTSSDPHSFGEHDKYLTWCSIPRTIPVALHLHAGSAAEVRSVNSKGSVHGIELKKTFLDVKPRCNSPCTGA